MTRSLLHYAIIIVNIFAIFCFSIFTCANIDGGSTFGAIFGIFLIFGFGILLSLEIHNDVDGV